MTASLAALGLVPAALSRGIGSRDAAAAGRRHRLRHAVGLRAHARAPAGDVPALRACHRVRAAAAARAARAARVGARPLAGRPAAHAIARGSSSVVCMTREGGPRRDRELNPPCSIGSSASRCATAPRCSSSRSWSSPGVVLLPRADHRGVSRPDRHPGQRHHALPGPADRGGRAPDRAADRARAERHAGAVAAAQPVALRAVLRHAHLRRRRRAAVRAPAGARAPARRRPARRRDAGARAARHADRRDLSLHAARRAATIRCSCAPCRTGSCGRALLRVDGVADVVSYGGLRARDPRAAPTRCASRRTASPRPIWSRPSDDGVGQRQRRRAGTRRRADGDPQPGAVPVARRHRARCASPPTTARRCSCATSPTVADGWAPRQGVVSRSTAVRHRRGHRAHAPRREPHGRAGARARRGRCSSTRACADDGAQVDAVLRPHRPGRHDAAHRRPQPARGRPAGHPRAVRLPARSARRADRRGRSSRCRCCRRSST